MLAMKGSVVKRAIKASGKTQGEVAELIGISREHLGRLLNGDIEDAYVDKLTKLGIEIPKETNSDVTNPQNEPIKHQPSNENAEMMLSMVSQLIKIVEADNVVLRKFMNLALESGAVTVKQVDKLKEDLK